MLMESLLLIFFCKRGIRQGDPLSSFLYILAADVLSKIFRKGKLAQVIRCLGPNYFDNTNLTNCHYADDTILFLEARHEVIEAALWAMKAFEAFFGIRINLDKTEMYGINIDNLEDLAMTFQCKTTQFPIKYLELPLHDRKLKVADWQFLVDKVESKLQHWKGQLLSLGERLTLINSVLSAVPLYALSLYRIPKSVVRKLDTIRCRFIWQGTDRSRKIFALIKWSVACIAKTYGGLGILDFRDMNIALLVQWWGKYRDPNYSSQWKTLLHFLYSHNPTSGSPFWIELNKLSILGSVSTRYTPGTTSTVRFWEDLWLGYCSLATKYRGRVCNFLTHLQGSV